MHFRICCCCCCCHTSNGKNKLSLKKGLIIIRQYEWHIRFLTIFSHGFLIWDGLSWEFMVLWKLAEWNFPEWRFPELQIERKLPEWVTENYQDWKIPKTKYPQKQKQKQQLRGKSGGCHPLHPRFGCHQKLSLKLSNYSSFVNIVTRAVNEKKNLKPISRLQPNMF